MFADFVNFSAGTCIREKLQQRSKFAAHLLRHICGTRAPDMNRCRLISIMKVISW
jgi:hypothetical protein